MFSPELLESEFQSLGVPASAQQLAVLRAYCIELERWNRRMNLTALTGPDLVRRLLVEPAWVARKLGMSGTVLDIGSGNGSPAIPIHIIAEMSRTHLVESRIRRAAFLRHVVGQLNLPQVIVHRGRFQELAPAVGAVDWVTLQGVVLDEQLIESMRHIRTATTTIVWFTARGRSALSPQERLTIPQSSTEVLIFRPDHS